MYSNASQAFDVYQAVVLQSEHSILNNDTLSVYSRLVQVYDKIPAIASTLSFYEFEFEEIDQWKVIYKNSQKTQLVIFVGMLIFELKINDIAATVKLAPEKAQFLFHQIFKKLASSSQKLKYNEQLEFKKQNDNKISYLFTYENLVDFCLGQLSEEDNEKVKAGLKLYPMLQIAKEEYSRIISQIQNLRVQKEMAAVSSQNSDTHLKLVEEETPKIKLPANKGLSKNYIRVAGAAAVLIILVLILQPGKIINLWTHKDNTIVLQQVEKPNSGVTNVAVNTPEVKAADKTETPATVASATVVAATPAPSPQTVAANTPPVPTPAPVVAVDKNTTVVAANKIEPKNIVGARSEGGLYRGTLFVQDITSANEKIKVKVSSLGATKAGEVALGWLKTPKLAYYHYTIAEANMAEVESFLKQIGQLQISFEKHPRKVPAGNRRFIIEVKQN